MWRILMNELALLCRYRAFLLRGGARLKNFAAKRQKDTAQVCSLEYVGLFCADVGLFCGDMRLFSDESKALGQNAQGSFADMWGSFAEI